MRKFVWMSALSLLIAAPALADAIYYPPQVTGKQERKMTRHLVYLANLQGDMKDVYDQYGFTTHRVRTNVAGRVTMTWTYLELGLVFEFDQCGMLVDSHEGVRTEQRRSWAYQRDVAGYQEDLECDR